MVSEAISECIIYKKKLWWEHVPALLTDACYAHIECAHAVPMYGYATAQYYVFHVKHHLIIVIISSVYICVYGSQSS